MLSKSVNVHQKSTNTTTTVLLTEILHKAKLQNTTFNRNIQMHLVPLVGACADNKDHT